MSRITLRPEVLRFAEGMERTLRINDHKGGWDEMRCVDLFVRLRAEVEELSVEIDGNMPEFIIHEAVDVANFAMMIADQASRMFNFTEWKR